MDLNPNSIDDKSQIENALKLYNAALNSGSSDEVMALYEEGGVFMPPFSESAIGTESVRRSYDAVFKELRFDVTFDIKEIVQVAPLWAFVRTNSSGSTHHASSDETTSESNQELFVLSKASGDWKIARYSFSPTKK